MANPDPKEVIFVCPSSQLKIRMMNHSVHAIADAVQALKATHFVAAMVIRYFPSRKGWRIIDIRKARRVSMRVGGSHDAWIGAFWLERTFPNEESAVMYALHALHSCTP